MEKHLTQSPSWQVISAGTSDMAMTYETGDELAHTRLHGEGFFLGCTMGQVKERKRLTRADYNSLIKAGYQLEPYKDLCNKCRDDYEEMLRTAKLKR